MILKHYQRHLVVLVLTIISLAFTKSNSFAVQVPDAPYSFLESKDRVFLDEFFSLISLPLDSDNKESSNENTGDKVSSKDETTNAEASNEVHDISISISNNKYKVNSSDFSKVIVKQYTYDKKFIKEFELTSKSGILPYGNIKLIATDKYNNSALAEVENYKPQAYNFRDGELNILANLIHREVCVSYMSSKKPPYEARRASMAAGYVLVNRALNNHCGLGQTITKQLKSGQYGSTAYSEVSGSVKCKKCYQIALTCAKYDSTYNYCIKDDNTISPMTNDVAFQSGWCVHVGKNFAGECWWHLDSDNDGVEDNYGYCKDGRWDEFFEKCQCCTEHRYLK